MMLADPHQEINLLEGLLEDERARANEFRDGWADAEGHYRVDMKRMRAAIRKFGTCRKCSGLTYTPADENGPRATCEHCDGRGMEPEAYDALYEGLERGQVVLMDGSVVGMNDAPASTIK